MFKPAHNIFGTLTQNINAITTVVPVNYDLANRMAVLLANGSFFTYMAIRNGTQVEIVKVVSANNNFFTVVRGVDGTAPASFTIGAEVDYVLAAAAVTDMINSALAIAGSVDMLTFSINSPNAVQVVDGNVEITVNPTSVSSPDGSIDVTGGGSNIGVSVARGAFGCCD